MAVAVPALLSAVGVAATGKALKSAVGSSGSTTLQPTPAAPTLDDAARNRDELDRIRRRRGVLANVFAGSSESAAAATVGTKALLGQ